MPLFGTYLLGFEVASVVLLVAAVGGVVLGARRPGAARGRRDRAVHRAGRAVPEAELQTAVMDAADAFDAPRDRPEGDG